MKLVFLIAAVFIPCQAAFAEQPAEPSAKLLSFHGTMIVLIDDKHGVEMEVWAKGNNVRSEIKDQSTKIVVIQRGDTLYTFSPGKKTGDRTRFESGLASLGLVEQIALVKSKGKKDGSQLVNGITYDQYSYDADAPHESALVLLEAKTSLPKDWVSIVKNGDREPVPARTIFRDMEANVEVADALFELPRDVQFKDVTAGDLMATPLPATAGDDSPAPKSSR